MDRIGELVALLQESLQPLGDEQEIIVVDDGSSDGTDERVAGAGVTFLRHEKNRGKAAAVQSGLALSTGAFVAVLDADLEYLPDDLLPMLERAEEIGQVAVYGSRYLEPANFRPGPAGNLRVLKDQELASWAANWTLTALVFGLFHQTITDTLTGLKLYPGEFLRSQQLTSVGFEGDHEITAKLIKADIPIVEVPITYIARARNEGKKIGPADGVKAVKTFVQQRVARQQYRNAAASPALMAVAASASRFLRAVPVARTGAQLTGQMADYVAWQEAHFGKGYRIRSRRERLWEEVASRLDHDRPILVLEFGVAWGYATSFWLEHLLGDRADLEWHGFDRFTGLPRSWRRFPVGAFDAQGKPPAIDDARLTWHTGDIEATLPDLDLARYATHQKVVLFDLDIYEPTVVAWGAVAPHLCSGDLLYFDEALDEDERRVLDELVLPSGAYEHLGSTSLSLALEVRSMSTQEKPGSHG